MNTQAHHLHVFSAISSHNSLLACRHAGPYDCQNNSVTCFCVHQSVTCISNFPRRIFDYIFQYFSSSCFSGRAAEKARLFTLSCQFFPVHLSIHKRLCNKSRCAFAKTFWRLQVVMLSCTTLQLHHKVKPNSGLTLPGSQYQFPSFFLVGWQLAELTQKLSVLSCPE